jgi:hypothetical protein
MRDESHLFWLEISGYQQLFPARVLDQEVISQKLLEVLALCKEHGLHDHDEILQRQRQVEGILKFLNGDLEDEQKERVATVYHHMLWGSTSLQESQREEAARQTAAKIERLRNR